MDPMTTLQDVANLMAQMEREQRQRMAEIVICLNRRDHDRIRAMLDDAGYDPVQTKVSEYVDAGTMIVIDLDKIGFSPVWDGVFKEGGEDDGDPFAGVSDSWLTGGGS